MDTQSTIDTIQQYYGDTLHSSADLQTSACCLTETVPPHIARILQDIHPDVRERFYGCGSPLPPMLTDTTVLDLGCGSGRDCYVLSKLVGPQGRVIGLDMTEAQITVARKHLAYHAAVFGYGNVHFLHGYIEDLANAGIADASIDVVVSNCVINLSPDKDRVFREIFRVLKPGGELFFADVFADRRLPVTLACDPVLLGECLGGALYTEDFRRIAASAGFADCRITSSTPLVIHNPDIERKTGNIGFVSSTVRTFKLPLEDRCEDYGQVATYKGSIPELPHTFVLDDHHTFYTGRPMLVCGNTADMLGLSRLHPHFQITGNKDVHFGLFDCTPVKPKNISAQDCGC